ncbi:tRNA-splicing endonuclease subunit Sen54 isoform X3 [Ranitomeya imitator]|uniref:tRNA-splicing endonuclease subunit Sen54 isoform X3 n=1 Tax=Ranitomeya imitator TaxID=111125 RepID=UPI0037E8FCC1
MYQKKWVDVLGAEELWYPIGHILDHRTWKAAYFSCSYVRSADGCFCASQYPAELFEVRSREQSLPQRSHGQKDFLPDGSQIQNEKLQICRAEQWELLGEERVERLSIQLPYERQINLEIPSVSNRKRKRSSITGLETQDQLETSGSNSREENKSSKPRISHCPEKVDSFTPEPIAFVPTVVENMNIDEEARNDNNRLESNETAHDHEEAAIVKSKEKYRWDFSKFCFPNCAHDQPYVQLPDPEPAFLPENVVGRQVNISLWLGKLNLRAEKFSRKEQDQLDWERKHKISINADPKIKKCRNWSEYKKLLQERERQSRRERPAHLWSSTVRPLLTPGQVTSTASVLEQVTIISQSTLLEDGKRLQDKQNVPQIHFNLYQADGNSEFKKSKPGKPYAYLCVRSFDEQIPSLRTIKSLAYQSGDIPVVFALVDCGEIAFYAFKDLQLPVDVYP